MNMNKKQLRKFIDETGFAMYDTVLFLDTHPDDAQALSYYHETKMLYEKAVSEYTKNFGPLRITDVNSDNYWTWSKGPWPWEGGCD